MLIVGALMPVCMTLVQAQPVMGERQWDSLSAGYFRQLSRLSSPALEARKANRLDLQRRGYANTLAATIRGNGLDALLAFIRMKIQLEFSLPHEPLVLVFPIVQPEHIPRSAQGFFSFGQQSMSVTLSEDWTFPEDPWHKEPP
jgi:hypothetical protein